MAVPSYMRRSASRPVCEWAHTDHAQTYSRRPSLRRVAAPRHGRIVRGARYRDRGAPERASRTARRACRRDSRRRPRHRRTRRVPACRVVENGVPARHSHPRGHPPARPLPVKLTGPRVRCRVQFARKLRDARGEASAEQARWRPLAARSKKHLARLEGPGVIDADEEGLRHRGWPRIGWRSHAADLGRALDQTVRRDSLALQLAPLSRGLRLEDHMSDPSTPVRSNRFASVRGRRGRAPRVAVVDGAVVDGVEAATADSACEESTWA